MDYFIAYDISNPKRRRSIVKILKGIGTRVQYSVFQVHVSPESFQNLIHRLENFVIGERDSILLIPLCKNCKGKTYTIGRRIENPIQEVIII